MNALLTWLLNSAPWMGTIAAVAIATYFITRYLTKLEYSHKKLSNKVSELPCKENKQSIQELHGMKSTLISINDQVGEITKWIMHMDDGMIDTLARKCSPRQMTKMGMELFDISGAKSAIDENIDLFIGEIEGKKPKTPFDAENYALDVLISNITSPIFNGIKNYIYYQPEIIKLTNENGEEKEVKISLNTLIRLMSIELRDRYLKKHPEIMVQSKCD